MELNKIGLDNLPGPDSVVRYRAERYIGDDQAAALEEFSQRDRELLLRLYDVLTAMRDETRAILNELEQSGSARALSTALISRWRHLLDDFSKEFGTEGRSDSVSKAIYHDLRGGALPLADLRVQTMPSDAPAPPEDVYSLFYAVRDQLKIIRNCIRDIDPPRREHDRNSNSHSMSLLRQKWSDYHSEQLNIDFVSDFDGVISSCCLEFSSLDRILYNLINNALNHAADGFVRVFAKQVGDRGHGDVRFVTANQVSDDEAEALSGKFEHGLGELFLSDFTIGGTGVGLQIVREIVANAYGLSDGRNVVEEGYVGAELREDVFLCWCHWPIMA